MLLAKGRAEKRPPKGGKVTATKEEFGALYMRYPFFCIIHRRMGVVASML